MRKMKKLTAILLSALMLIGMFGTVANAAESTTLDNGHISKKLGMSGLVKEYPTMTFEFDFKKLTDATEEGKAELIKVIGDNYKDYLGIGNQPELLDAKITINGAERAGADVKPGTEKVNVTETADIKQSDNTILEASDFENRPGIYVYKVTETELVNNWGTTTADTPWGDKLTDKDKVYETGEVYYLIVSVRYDTDANEYVLDLFAKKETEVETTENTTKTEYPKVNEITFENEYEKGSGSPGPQNPDDPTPPTSKDLSVSKKVEGQLGDQKKFFDFELTIFPNETPLDGTTSYNATIVRAAKDSVDATTTTVTVTFNEPTTFTLSHGDELYFEELPVGTRYVLTEKIASSEGYTQSMVVTEGGQTGQSVTGTLEDGKFNTISTDDSTYVREGANTVVVTNSKGSTPFTGVVTDNLSFILLIGVAAAGMAAYVVMKRRLRNI